MKRENGKRLDLAHFSLGQLLEMEACTRCGECIEACPTFAEARSEAIHPQSKITTVKSFWKAEHLGWLARLLRMQPANEERASTFSQGLYQCTLCGRCHEVCPVRIDTRALWVAMREQAVTWGAYPETFDLLRERVTSDHNISGESNEERMVWTQNLERVPQGLVNKEGAETVYLLAVSAPCTRAPLACLRVSFRSWRLRVKISPPWEGMSGVAVFLSRSPAWGKTLAVLAAHNVERVRAIGAQRLVTTCPSCYHTWHEEYPSVSGRAAGI